MSSNNTTARPQVTRSTGNTAQHEAIMSSNNTTARPQVTRSTGNTVQHEQMDVVHVTTETLTQDHLEADSLATEKFVNAVVVPDNQAGGNAAWQHINQQGQYLNRLRDGCVERLYGALTTLCDSDASCELNFLII